MYVCTLIYQIRKTASCVGKLLFLSIFLLLNLNKSKPIRVDLHVIQRSKNSSWPNAGPVRLQQPLLHPRPSASSLEASWCQSAAIAIRLRTKPNKAGKHPGKQTGEWQGLSAVVFHNLLMFHLFLSGITAQAQANQRPLAGFGPPRLTTGLPTLDGGSESNAQVHIVFFSFSFI